MVNEQPPQLADDDATLGSIPTECCEIILMNSTWVTDRTIIVRMTSKRVKEVVDKVRRGIVVHLSRSFWDESVEESVNEDKPVARKGTVVYWEDELRR
jgi:hypothetical protein